MQVDPNNEVCMDIYNPHFNGYKDLVYDVKNKY